MYIVYILTSKKYPSRYYIGITANLERRLSEHNVAKSIYTAKYAPWQVEVYISVRTKKKAEELERYFKSGSGFAFLKKRLL